MLLFKDSDEKEEASGRQEDAVSSQLNRTDSKVQQSTHSKGDNMEVVKEIALQKPRRLDPALQLEVMKAEALVAELRRRAQKEIEFTGTILCDVFEISVGPRHRLSPATVGLL
jgi:hypothetical protein